MWDQKPFFYLPAGPLVSDQLKVKPTKSTKPLYVVLTNVSYLSLTAQGVDVYRFRKRQMKKHIEIYVFHFGLK